MMSRTIRKYPNRFASLITLNSSTNLSKYFFLSSSLSTLPVSKSILAQPCLHSSFRYSSSDSPVGVENSGSIGLLRMLYSSHLSTIFFTLSSMSSVRISHISTESLKWNSLLSKNSLFSNSSSPMSSLFTFGRVVFILEHSNTLCRGASSFSV